MTTALEWWPKQFGPGDIDGDGALKLLGKPNLHPVSILVRETAQNSWDARVADTVRYSIHGRTLEGKALEDLRTRVFSNKGKGQALNEILKRKSVQVLEISDRGTSGLGGPLRNDIAHTSATTDYIDFVLNIGAKRDKTLGAGTYGFGKTISYITSSAHTILIWSRSNEQEKVESRLIGSAFGDRFELRGKRYTGRQWWGRKARRGEMVEPVIGTAADSIANSVFASSFDKEETGTSLMIIDPALLGLGLAELVDACGEAILWNLWPKLVRPPGATGPPPMEISLKLEGRDVPIADPEKHPVLGNYVSALQAIRAVQSEKEASNSPFLSIHSIELLRPAVTLGHLAIQSAAVGHQTSPKTADDALENVAPIQSPTHSIALMRRDAELVVTYLPVPRSPVEGVDVAGVFRCTAEVDNYFSASEPPAHDAWEPNGMLDKTAKRHVNVGLRRIREVWRAEILGASGGKAARPSGGSEGYLASQLSDLVPALDGTRAGKSKPTSGSGADRGGGGGTRLEKSTIHILNSGSLARANDLTLATVSFRIEGPPQGCVVECTAGVGYDGGTDRDSSLVSVEGFAPGRPSSSGRISPERRGPTLEIEGAEQTDWTVIVSHASGLAIDIDLRVLKGNRS